MTDLQVTQLSPLRRWMRLAVLAALTGAASGLAAAAMEWGLNTGMGFVVGRVAAPASAEILRFRILVVLLPALGGLLSAVLVLLFCPSAIGHGTDVVTRAFHWSRGVLGLRGPTVKAVGAVMVISCGGSAGPEGPVVALGAALGSTCGRLFGVSSAQRRTLLIAGCAAGIGAIFRCPLGGALFAVSILYSEPDYESDAIVPSFIASVAGYSVYLGLWGWGGFLIQGAQRLVFFSPLQLLPFLVLGPLCGLVSIFFGTSFRVTEKILAVPGRLPRWMAPAIGGLMTGGLACFLPQVMDARYEFLQAGMDGTLFSQTAASWWWWAGLFGAVALLKCLATSFTVGSGGAGGILGPSLAIGGASGACLGAVCEALFPGTFPESLRQALIPVGMGGVLAAIMRVPLAAVVMAVEMTGSYGLIVPTMLVCVTSYVIGRRWGLNAEQVGTSSESPVHAVDTIVRLLESTHVSDLTDRDWPLVIPPQAGLHQIGKHIQPGQRPTFMVVQDGQLRGVISLPHLERVLSDAELAPFVIAHDIMSEHFETLTPERDLYHALELFRHVKHPVLPVVSRDHPPRFLGVLTKRKILDTLITHVNGLKEFALREHQTLLAVDEETRLEHLLTSLADSNGPQVRRLMVPLDAVGQSIRESDFHNRYRMQIVAIEQPDGSLQCPPDPNARLQTSQRLLVIVQSSDELAAQKTTDEKRGRTT